MHPLLSIPHRGIRPRWTRTCETLYSNLHRNLVLMLRIQNYLLNSETLQSGILIPLMMNLWGHNGPGRKMQNVVPFYFEKPSGQDTMELAPIST